MNKKLLSLGFGDLATRYAPLFTAANCEVHALARSAKAIPEQVNFVQDQLRGEAARQLMADTHFDAAIITLTPDGSDEAAYKNAYNDNLRYLLTLWQTQPAPKFVVFVSSTAVYGQSGGEWVDELSATSPQRHNGRQLLAAEQLLAASGLPHCIVRFSGVYAENRQYLIRQVKAGGQGGRHYGNRIHAADCAAILHFICQQHWRGELAHNLYLASDCLPVTGVEIHTWLARQLGMEISQLNQPAKSPGRAGNKRCGNQRLLDAGYRFRYPTYREGYAQVLAHG